MKQNRLLTALLLIWTAPLFAQQEQSLLFMNDVWQTNLLNPARVPAEKKVIALPSLFTNINSPDVVINDLTGQQDGKKVLIVNKLYENDRPEIIRANAKIQMQTLGLAIPINEKLTLTAHHAATADPSVSVRRDLLRVFAEGNAAFLGKTVSFGSSGSGSIRSEFAVGAAYNLTNLTIGARAKMHFGIASVITQNSKADVSFASSDYAMRFQTDFDILAFKGSAIKEYDGLKSLLGNGLTSKNTGFSFDLGATLKLDKLQISASAIDLGGKINWKSNGTRYQSKGDFTYRGVNLNSTSQFFNWGNVGSQTYIDTLKKIVGLTETTEGVVFTQKLPTRLFLLGIYQLNEQWRLGALVCHEFGGAADSETGFALNSSAKVLKIIDLGATLGLRNGSISNIGGHISAQLSIVKVFAVTDNLLTTFNPYGAKNANGRLGINLIF